MPKALPSNFEDTTLLEEAVGRYSKVIGKSYTNTTFVDSVQGICSYFHEDSRKYVLDLFNATLKFYDE